MLSFFKGKGKKKPRDANWYFLTLQYSLNSFSNGRILCSERRTYFYHLLRAPSFFSFSFDLLPHLKEEALPSPTYQFCPTLTQMTAAQPLRLSVVSSRKLSLTLPIPHTARPWPGEERTLCWLHTAHTTIPIPTWDHVIYICLLFPKRKWTPQGPGPNLYVPAWSTGSGRMFFPIIPPFQKIYASEPQEMRIHAEPVVSHSAL